MLDLRFFWKHQITGARRPLPLKRTLNAGLSKLAQAAKLKKTYFMPFMAVVEPTNICQLQCPLCISGMKVKGRPKGQMSLDTAARVVEQLGPYLFDVELDNWGETFLNPKTLEIIRMFKSAKVHTEVSSNLSLRNFDPEEVVKSGLDLLVVSTDGATEASYLKYRKGGDFNLVLSNVKALADAKRKMGKNNPFILMKFLTFPHNIHEQDDFQKLASGLGADKVLFWPPYYPSFLVKNYFENLTDEQVALLNKSEPQPMLTCYWPWSAVAINWDGGISVCCAGNSYHARFDLGNINETPFREIWFGDLYNQVRQVFSGSEPKDPRARPCWMCYTGRQDALGL
jgi:MoaA/NifB/PqqE/SkfB family radical SAM enzyme